MKLRRLKALRLPYKVQIDHAVVDSTGIYLGDSRKDVIALEREDYSVRWEVAAKRQDPICVARGVLVLGGSGWLRGVNVRDGTALWVTSANHGLCQPWRDQLLLVPEEASTDRTVYSSLDPTTGFLLEQFSFSAYAEVLGDRFALVHRDDTNIECIDLHSQRIAWKLPVLETARAAANFPVEPHQVGGIRYHADDTFVVQRNDGLAAYQLSTGQLRWSRGLPGPATAAAAIDLGCVVVTTRTQMLCFDVETGETLWTRQLEEPEWLRKEENPPITWYNTLPPSATFRGAFVVKEPERVIRLLHPRTGESLAEYSGPLLGNIVAGEDELVSLLGYGRVDILACAARTTRRDSKPVVPRSTRG